MVVSSRLSALGGMVKNESLDEIRRYIDEDAGIVVESISTVDDKHPLHRKPSRGYKRTDNTIRSVWAACGPEHSVFRSVGSLALPFQSSKRMLTTLGGLVGKYVLDGSLEKLQLIGCPSRLCLHGLKRVLVKSKKPEILAAIAQKIDQLYVGLSSGLRLGIQLTSLQKHANINEPYIFSSTPQSSLLPPFERVVSSGYAQLGGISFMLTSHGLFHRNLSTNYSSYSTIVKFIIVKYIRNQLNCIE